MENPILCRQRAEQALSEANDPSTMPNLRARLLESAERWEAMANDAERFERERLKREAESAARLVEAGKKPVEPRVRKRWQVPEELPVLVLTKRMIAKPETVAA